MATMHNNGGKSQDINTFGPSFYNADRHVRVSSGFWKSNLSLTIEEVRQGDKGYLKGVEGTANKISITGSTISTLESIIEGVIESIKTTGTFESEGTECGVSTRNFIGVSNGSEIGEQPGIYLVFYKDLDNNNIPKEVAVYPFNGRISVKNYNPKTGQGKAVKRDTQELKDFKRLLAEAGKAATKALAHAVKDLQNSDNLKVFGALSKLCVASGIDVMQDNSGYSNKGGNNNRRSAFDESPTIGNSSGEDFDAFNFDTFDDFSVQ